MIKLILDNGTAKQAAAKPTRFFWLFSSIITRKMADQRMTPNAF